MENNEKNFDNEDIFENEEFEDEDTLFIDESINCDINDDETENLTSQETDAENAYDETEEEGGKGIMAEIFEWIQAIAVAVVIAMFLRTFIFTMVNVDGTSMVPTLHDGDRLVVWRLGYNPEVGDIIVFRPKNSPQSPYIKRVIAVEGQTVDIKFNESGVCDVYVDGQKLNEEYINEPITLSKIGDQKYPIVVPEDHVFAMGDNRNHSFDSRWQQVDVVSEDSIIGHALFRFWPLNDIGGLN